MKQIHRLIVLAIGLFRKGENLINSLSDLDSGSYVDASFDLLALLMLLWGSRELIRNSGGVILGKIRLLLVKFCFRLKSSRRKRRKLEKKD